VIKDLRKKFIRITMLAVAMVMILLCLIVNTANYLSVNSELNSKLDTICQNQGTIPVPEKDGKPPENAGREPFSREEPYSTRYFVLKFDDSGKLSDKSLEHIATVTESDVDEFLEVAVKAGDGYGYYSLRLSRSGLRSRHLSHRFHSGGMLLRRRRSDVRGQMLSGRHKVP